MNNSKAAGIVFDFAAYLTTRDEAVTLGRGHDAAPAAEAAREFLRARGIGALRKAGRWKRHNDN